MTEDTPEGALAGLTVVDLSRVLGGPFATQILGDHGARVIKIEPPQGDETRFWGPPFLDGETGGADGEADPPQSAYYAGINRNKRGMALDLRRPEGRDVLLRLLERADVLVENFKPGSLEKWGLGYEAVLKARFPRLVHCRVSGFGAEGPLGKFPGYDAVAQAMTGLIGINGSETSGPVRIGVPVVDLATGLNAVIGILMALQERARSGRGQFVEATLYDTGLSLMHPHGANWFASGKLPALTGNAHPNVFPYDLFETATRPIFLGIGNDRQFAKACAHLGRPDLAEDPRFATNALRGANRDALTAELAALLADKDGDALARDLLAAGVPAGPANTVAQAFDDPHTAARDMRWRDGAYEGTGAPVKLSRTPPGYRAPPPRFGADTRALLADLGYTEDEIARLIEEGVTPADTPGTTRARNTSGD